MKRLICSALRRTAAAVLGAVMLCGLTIPALPVRAEETAAPEGELLVQMYDSYGNPVGEPLKDGGTVPYIKQFGNLCPLLCRGDAQSPVRWTDASVELISHATGEPIPSDVLTAQVWADGISQDYARYALVTPSSEAASNYFASVSPDFGIDMVFTSGGDTLTLHILNEGVEVQMSSDEINIDRVGFSEYRANLGGMYVVSEALQYYAPTVDWVARDFYISGDLAQYFTVGLTSGSGVALFAGESLAQLENGTTLTGTLHWTGKLDGQPHSRPLRYFHIATLHGDWYEWYEPTKSWSICSDKALCAGDKGSFELRIFPGNAPTNGPSLPLDETSLTADFPAGMRYTLQPDGCTVLVEYDLTSADVREQPYSLQVNIPGAQIFPLQIRVESAPLYDFALFAWDSYGWSDPNQAYAPTLRTMMADAAIVPLIDGRPVSTLEELEQCALTVRDSEDPDSLRTFAKQTTYRDQNGETWETWVLCLQPLRQTSHHSDPIAQTPALEMVVEHSGEVLGTIRYDVSGCDNPDSDIPLRSDYMTSFNVGEARDHDARFLMQDENGQPLLLTEAPIVTGSAAQNVSVAWAEGVSGVWVTFAKEQVPGQAVVELRSGDTVRKVVYTFRAFLSSFTYYSTGMDYLHRSYTESLAFTENLGSISIFPGAVNTTRFVEDGSFELYLYSSQYIAGKNFATTDEINALSRLSFGTELVKSITYTSSDPDILRIESEITHTTEKDPVFNGNGYTNPEGRCHGIRLVPGGKTGSCDVYASIELNIPSKNDPFGCDTSKTPSSVVLGLTFNVQSSETVQTVHAGPDDLLEVLEGVELSPAPVVVLLEGGEYPMDLNLAGKNVILRSEDPENPAVFTGAPGQEGGFIITVDAPSPDFALEDLVIDGGGVRGGILQKPYSGQQQNSFTVRRCLVRSCTTGVKTSSASNVFLRQTTLRGCDIAVNGASLFSCTLDGNDVAMISGTARWSRFMNNQVDFRILSDLLGPAEYTLNLPQNYWNGASGPVAEVVDAETGKPLTGKTIHVYSSPYYTDPQLSMLSVDLSTTQIQDDTLLLPLQQSSEQAGSLLVSASAFAAIQQSDMSASFPISDENGAEVARWQFPSIQRTGIDTDLDVSDQLSDEAQQAVDKLPQADKDKILQEVNLSHNGELPGRATLYIKPSELPSGNLDDLRLYWVKPDGTIVPAEVVEVLFDEVTGCYVITVDHCSEYIITSGSLSIDEDTAQPSPAPTAVPTAAPNPTDAPSVTPDDPRPTAAPQKTPAPASSGQSQLYSAQQALDAFAAQQGDVALDVSAQTKVSQKVFELLASRPGAQLRLQGSAYAWVFAADTLLNSTLPDGVFDTGVSLAVSDTARTRIDAFAAGMPWEGFETAFSGTLPGPAHLELTFPSLAGARCTLYLLPDEGDPVSVASLQVESDGKASIPLEHCSVYFLLAEEQPDPAASPAPTALPAETPAPSPAPAADSSAVPVLPIAAGAAAVLLAGIAVWAVRRKK